MPRMDGYETLESLRADPELASIPVVVCTAKREKADVVKARRLGATAYIVKPFTAEPSCEKPARRRNAASC